MPKKATPKKRSSTRVLLPIYQEIDRSMQIAAERHHPTCTKGCSACCELLVVLTAVEADALADRVVNDPALKGDVEAILANLDRQSVALVWGADDIGPLRHEWWQARHQCALLDPETKLCRVYEYRPAPCRTHLVVSDPALCGRRTPTNTSQVNLGEQGQVALLQWLLAACEDAGLPTDVGTLPDMLASAIRRKLGRPEPKTMPGAAIFR